MAFEDLHSGRTRQGVVWSAGHGGQAGEEGCFRRCIAGVDPLVPAEAWTSAVCRLVGSRCVRLSAEFVVLGAELSEFGLKGGHVLGAGAELRDFIAEAHEFEFIGMREVGLLGTGVSGGSGVAQVGFELVNSCLKRVAVAREGLCLAPGRGCKQGSSDEQGEKEPGKFVHKNGVLSFRIEIRQRKRRRVLRTV